MKVSRDNPHYYLTAVTHCRLPVFKTRAIKKIFAESVNEARKSHKFKIFFYVLMPDHYHLLTGSERASSDIVRYVNGISARRILDYLKANSLDSSLKKLRTKTKSGGWKYSLWQHHSNVFPVNNERTLVEKINYIHLNPVHAGLVKRPEEYEFSSARIWLGKPFDNEPISTDPVDWRKA